MTAVRGDTIPAWEHGSLRSAAALIRELTEGTGVSQPLSTLVNRICQAQADEVDARVSMFLVEGDRLVPAACSLPGGRTDEALWARFCAATVPLALVETVRDERRPRVAARGSRLIDEWWAETFDLVSACGIPVGLPGDVVGVLVFDRPEPDAFGDQFVSDAMGAAADLSAILRWGRMTEEVGVTLKVTSATRRLLAESAEATSALQAASTVARLMHEVLQTENTVVFYRPDLDSDAFEVTTVGVPASLEQTVRDVMKDMTADPSPGLRSATAGHAVFVDAVQADQVRRGGLIETLGVQSYISLPLLTSEGQVGHVLTGEVARPRPWKAWEKEFVNQVAGEATLVMDSARLREADRLHREQLVHQATHDALTGLPNRRAFSELLPRALATAAGQQCEVAVLLLDLDRFKTVNDTLGHHSGDRLLVEVARSLLGTLREPDFVARLGGDEFAVILPEASQSRAEVVAVRLAEAVEAGRRRARIPVEVAASIGIAVFPEDGADSDALLQAADAAMYEAKRSEVGHRAYRDVSPGLVASLGMGKELQRAIRDDELVLVYQPKVELGSGATVGVEALVRWRHPKRGLLAPDQFLPMLETAGLMPVLTAWVLKSAVCQAGQWRDEGIDLALAVNITSSDLAGPSLLGVLEAVLEESGFPAHMLTLELTEQTIVSDKAGAVAALDAVRRLGVRVSIDDFGTGYSSLAYLESLPIDELKIDRGFLLRSGLAAGAGTVLRSIIRLGHELRLTVVAEGVEAANMPGYLNALGCDQAQGFYFAAPLDPGAVPAWLESRR